MPVQVSYPGVYIEEIPSSPQTVTAASTSNTAFVDIFNRGPVNRPIQVSSMRDVSRTFGGLALRSEASYGLLQYFNNGGQTAFVVRVQNGSAAATLDIPVEEPPIDAMSRKAQELADQAQTTADQVWQLVTGSPPASPPGSPPFSPPNVSPPTSPPDAVATTTSQVAVLTQQVAELTRQAATYARATGVLLEQDVTKYEAEFGTEAQETFEKAEQAAALAQDAAAAADEAAQAADRAATADPLASPPSSPATDSSSADALVQALDAAANQSLIAAARAAAAAQAAAIAAQQDAAAAAGPTLGVTAGYMGSENPGRWGNNVQVAVQIITGPSVGNGSNGSTTPPNPAQKSFDPTQGLFNLFVQEVKISNGAPQIVSTEQYLNLTLDPTSANFAVDTVNARSSLVKLDLPEGFTFVPGATPQGVPTAPGPQDFKRLAGGQDDAAPTPDQLVPTSQTGGIYALDRIAPQFFNILCLPALAPYLPSTGPASEALTGAINYCSKNHAFLIVDIPSSVQTTTDMQRWMGVYASSTTDAAAVYFPRLQIQDPLAGNRLRNVGPSGTLAGIYARTDLNVGVWKAPAGVSATLQGAQVTTNLSDAENGEINPLGVNALRTFPIYNNIVWGGRTMAGADQIGSQFKYINVRRLTDFVEQSLFQSLKWVVFEPNDEATWSQIRTQVGSFLAGLFADGAFAGATPDQAYFVQVDSSTTTPTDIDNGILNIIVGIAPVKPAEFVVIQIEQIAGQTS